MVQSADVVVMSDCDDVMEPARVEAARRLLASADVVGCALTIIGEDGTPLGPVFGSGEKAGWRNDLLRHNVFGLSNSAFRSETLLGCLPIPREAVLIDWYLITLAVDRGARVTFDEAPLMRYRQYGSNTASVMPPFTGATVARSTDLVLTHYDLLLRREAGLSARMREDVEHARADAERFRSVFATDERVRGEYVHGLNALEPRYVWWWCVANSQLEHLWKR
jgi:hypothetical protein